MQFTTVISPTYLLQLPRPTSSEEGPAGVTNVDIKVTVYPYWYQYATLEWTVPASLGVCKYHVYASFGGNTEFERLTNSMLTDPVFRDTSPKETSRVRHQYYVVEAYPDSGAPPCRSLPFSGEFSQRGMLSRISSEIQRREYLLLTKFNGVKSFLFRRKTFGARCSRCWNPELEKSMDSNCTTCFGTSFEGGFYKPLPVFLQFEPTPSSKDLEYFGTVEQNQIGAWTISTPKVEAWDVIIRTGDWAAFHVARLSSTEMQTTSVRQMLVLTQLSRSDIKSRLLIKSMEDNAEYLRGLGGPFSELRFPSWPVSSTTSDDPGWVSESTNQTLPQKYIV